MGNPETAIGSAAVPWCTQVDADLLDGPALGLVQIGDPHVHVRIVHHGQRGLVLVAADTGTCIVRGVQHAVGHNQVGRAAGLEAAEVARAPIFRQIVVACCGRPESEQVLAGNRVVTAISAAVGPGRLLAGEGILAREWHSGQQVVCVSVRDDGCVVEYARSRVFGLIGPDHLARRRMIRRHPSSGLADDHIPGRPPGLQEYMMLLRVTQPCPEYAFCLSPDLLACGDVKGS